MSTPHPYAEPIARIREQAKTDHAALLRALDILLDSKVAGMRGHITMHANSPRSEFRRGYCQAYDNAADHIEEALIEAFDMWPADCRDKTEATQ